mmetsp:Transcript_13513/g.41022  ORF Transcript_13513/g.41022 Transcript_13513/m.41022 type:complete len:89 (-) Transcript_13513:229-495(-)
MLSERLQGGPPATPKLSISVVFVHERRVGDTPAQCEGCMVVGTISQMVVAAISQLGHHHVHTQPRGVSSWWCIIMKGIRIVRSCVSGW